MKKNNNKHSSARRKLAAATAMLLISALVLSSATYAWFTMNKTVSVTNMQVKAHAEEGLLINEVKAAADTNWDEEAFAKTTAQTIALRPASTADLATWFHANSLKSSIEAGVDNLSGTVSLANGDKYTNLTSGTTDYVLVGPETAASGDKATGNSMAETHIYYSDASFGSGSQYDDGEGFYVNYKYYLKASSTDALKVPATKLGVEVTADKVGGGSGTDLDKALRVGVKIGNDFLIFAPTGGQTDYSVTTNVTGSSTAKPNVVNTKTGINKTELSIPSVNTDGLLVDVYVWFEGEDKDCKSDNLTAVLNAYEINITFTDDAI